MESTKLSIKAIRNALTRQNEISVKSSRVKVVLPDRTIRVFTITAVILVRSLAFLLSISGQTREFIIYAMLQGTRAGNLTICYRKKQIVLFNASVLLLTMDFVTALSK